MHPPSTPISFAVDSPAVASHGAANPENSEPARGKIDSRMEAGWDVIAGYRVAIIRFLQRKCRDIHQAEDLAHDTLIKAARYSDSLTRVARPGAWLIQIAANIQRDFVRKEVRHRWVPPSDEIFQAVAGSEPIPGDVPGGNYYEVAGQRFGEEQLVAEVRTLWQGMSVRDRTVLSSYYRDGGSSELAAENCGIDRRLVKIRLFRARRRLEADLRRRLGCA